MTDDTKNKDFSMTDETKKEEDGGNQPTQRKNKYSLDDLRLTQDFESLGGSQKILTTVPIRKPDNQWFFRVRGGDYRAAVFVLEDNDSRKENYIVLPGIAPDIEAEIMRKTLHLAINRRGDLFLLPLKMPGPDGRTDRWQESMGQAIEMAETAWVRVKGNMGMSCYDIFQANGNLPDPQWPDMSFEDIFRIAVRDKIIDDENHPLLRSLRGEI